MNTGIQKGSRVVTRTYVCMHVCSVACVFM